MPPRVCVIGAGCSGITAIKNLLQAGIKDVVCYEQNDQVGGNWIYSAEESHSSVCETTHIISSKALSQYQDYPMPADYPDYPSHAQVLAYFQAYARDFGLLPYIRFNSRVERVRPLPGGQWEVALADGAKEVFDYLLVSNGHHSVPRHPEWKDAFTGTYLHAHHYKQAAPFAGQRVLVVGAGNSGCDCAVEISRVAASVDLSIRTPQYIVPKFMMGKPTDTFNETLIKLPRPVARIARRVGLFLQVGRYQDYGLEPPQHDILAAHPTVNSELLYKIRHGKVQPRRGIARVEGQTVHFTDGSQGTYDSIVAATGYQLATPFFEPDFLDFRERDRIELYLRMFHPDHPSLIFIGLFQPQGAIWPLSDYQAQLAANYLMGRWAWPADIAARARQDADAIERAFLKRKRHNIEVHYHAFLKQLQREIPADAPAWQTSRETA